jgi:putative heme iron utilization protein
MNEADARREAARLIFAQRWFALGTIDEHGVPNVSYVPFAVAGGAFSMVASRLAAHSANLLARRPASILLVDEGEPGRMQRDAYAQPRFSIGVDPRPQSRGSAPADAIWASLEARHGATAAVLRTLPDFEAIALVPTGGRLVLGFASARDIDGPAIIDAFGLTAI